jgi:hypothetical protein
MQKKKTNDLVVFITRSDGECTECKEAFGRGNWIFLDDGKPFCMRCAALDHLEHLPPGNATLTRRAGKYSPIRAVLVQWSRARKRYERQGILVTVAANRALQTMGYDTAGDICPHGFRAMARTLLAEQLHFQSEVIEHQLAHKVPDALGTAYNRTKFLAERKAMMTAWSDYLDELKAVSVVVRFPTAS